MKSSGILSPSQGFSGFILLVIILNLMFMSFLTWSSRVIIFHDSIGYQDMANMFAQGNWEKYFVDGPNREPLYSLLIASSMWIAQCLNLNYIPIHITIQVFIFLMSQILLYKLLKTLNVSDGISAVTLTFMNFSPGLVSSVHILYSEIITYPLVLWLVLALIRSWRQLQSATMAKTVLNAILLALPALLLTFTKASFELIIPILLLPFAWRAYQSIKTQQRLTLMRIGIILAVVLVTLQTSVTVWKLCNKHYNGIYALTNRGPEALYGNTVRRMKPLSYPEIQTAAAYMVGLDFCAEIYGMKCLQWGYLESDQIGANKIHTLLEQGMDRQKINSVCIRESIALAFKNPFQYFFLGLIESLKMFFWETPGVPYVVYPDFIEQTTREPKFMYRFRFIMAAFCLLTVLWTIIYLWMNRKHCLRDEALTTKITTPQFFVIWTILAFISVHSAFFILPRYALPIAPLFLAIIAFSTNCLCEQLVKSSHHIFNSKQKRQ